MFCRLVIPYVLWILRCFLLSFSMVFNLLQVWILSQYGLLTWRGPPLNGPLGSWRMCISTVMEGLLFIRYIAFWHYVH